MNKKISFFLIFSISSVICFLPPPDGLTTVSMKTLGILFLAILFWLFEIFEPAVTSLIVIVLIPIFQIMSFEKLAIVFSSPFLWLLVGVLIISKAINISGLDKRIALNLIKLAGSNTRNLLFSILFTIMVFSFFIPMSIGRSAIVYPIVVGLLESIGIEKRSNISKAFLIAVSFASVLTSVTVMTGANAVVYSVNFFSEELHFEWSYLYWILAFFPLVLGMLLIVGITLLKLFPFEVDHVSGGKEFIDHELGKMGPISIQEKKIIVLMVILIGLWLTKNYHFISIELAALLITILFFVPGIELISWEKINTGINWGMIFVFSASLAISMTLQETGVINWISLLIVNYVDNVPSVVLVILILILSSILRFAFTTTLGLLVTMLPLFISLAGKIEINPVWLGMVTIVGSLMSLLFPTQSPENLITYNSGSFTSKEMMFAGVISLVFIIGITILVSELYWPLIGIKPH